MNKLIAKIKAWWADTKAKIGVPFETPDIKPEPPAPPAETPKPPYEVVDLTQAEWWGKRQEMGTNFAVVSKLTVTDVNGSTFRLNLDPGIAGRDQVACYFVKRDGRWVGGGFDGCGETQFRSKVKTWGNAKSGIPGRSSPMGESKGRDYVKVRSGDNVALCVISTQARARTEAYVVRFP